MAAPIARLEAGAAVYDGRMFVLGGHTGPDLDTTNRMYAYDPDTDQWTRHADLPMQLSHFTAAVDDARADICLAGGYEGRHPGRGVANAWRYSVNEDRWHPMPPLPEVRAIGGFVRIERAVHYFGGLGADRHTNFHDHWAMSLDDLQGWSPRAPMPAARGHFANIVVDGKIYALGGHFFHDPMPSTLGRFDRADLDFVHRYDPTTDAWEQLKPLPTRRSHIEPSTVVYNGQIMMIGGRNNSPDAVSYYQRRTMALQCRRAWRKLRRIGRRSPVTGLLDIVAYNPADQTWQTFANLLLPVYGGAAGIIGDQLIITGGGLEGWRNPTDRTLVADLNTCTSTNTGA